MWLRFPGQRENESVVTRSLPTGSWRTRSIVSGDAIAPRAGPRPHCVSPDRPLRRQDLKSTSWHRDRPMLSGHRVHRRHVRRSFGISARCRRFGASRVCGLTSPDSAQPRVCGESVAATRPGDRAWSYVRDAVAADGDRRRVGGHDGGVCVRRGMVNIDVMKSLPRGALNRLLTPRPEIRRVSKQLSQKRAETGRGNQRPRSSFR